ncbi:MAG TPA: LuxR C-terminal-related transcriptional regulator [Candidatus Rubrimentiphilum sp.]|nr:LuxR C-terminal-related transcriptional regulator [Candidatus Rubrimentiphilum sp.]
MTRLADAARPAGPATLSPIVRPRISQRIDAAAAGRIVLIVAPAGYGKSLALSHWLVSQRRYLRFDVQAEHNTLLGFARGIAEAFSEFPALRKTVATAFKNSASAAAPGHEMARWMAAHLEGFDGIIAIDDFHRASDDIEVSRFLASLIARTKPNVRWVLATRSTLDLPVASWLAYGESQFVIGDRDLTFQDDETLELSESRGQVLSTRALRGVMEATSGWPVALGLALRSESVLNGGAELSHSTREVLFRYLAEQVYAELSNEERDLLHFAAYLPSIDVSVIEIAGYHSAARVLENVRRKATFLSLKSPGKYACHDLFREFLRGQIEFIDPSEAKRLQEKAASALDRNGDIVAALRLYTQLHASDVVLRLLRENGFSLMDHSHGDVVESALRAVPADSRSSDAIILGLRAQRAADAGHFERAESLFRSALNAADESNTVAMLVLRLAVMMINEGRSPADLLELSTDVPSANLRAEVLSLLSADYSNRGDVEKARWAISEAERLCVALDDQAVIAKVNLRTSVAGMNIGCPAAQVRRAALTAADMATQAGLLMLVGRAYTALATISLFLDNDLRKHVYYAQAAMKQAVESGDRDCLETALLQLACAEAQLGDGQRLRRFLDDLRNLPNAQRHDGMLESLRAVTFVWDGDFEKAERLISLFRRRGYNPYYTFDKAVDMAWHALCCVAIGDAANGLSISHEALTIFRAPPIPHPYAKAQYEIAEVICEMAQVMGRRLLGLRGRRPEVTRIETPVALALKSALTVLSEIDSPEIYERAVSVALQELALYDSGGISKTIVACIGAAAVAMRTQNQEELPLTPAELSVMKAVGQGLSSKEIASQTGRSVHTVRTLIQRAIAKLGCTRRHEAVQALRHRGIKL